VRGEGWTGSGLRRLAFIGNSLPRRCGIATFTTDLQQSVAASRPDIETSIVAMNDHGRLYDYPPVVAVQIDDQRIEDYHQAARVLNAGRFDVVCLQHEFGIFGGEAGEYILALLARLTVPLVTTLHTVLSDPTPRQRGVLDGVVKASTNVIVMAEKARQLLMSVYDVPAKKIVVIEHGIPDFAFVEPDQAKASFGFSGKTVILTFGLLSPSKGIEVMIDAMPGILESCPNAVYMVLGATHPNLVRQQGEAYRDGLVDRVRKLGIEDHVVFRDEFLDQATLLRYISMCDVYATPYLNEHQMTSGTLAFSFGLGKAVVSTPYWHAQELLADGRGILVPFGDAAAIGGEIGRLLIDEPRRQAMRTRAYLASRSMTWPKAAERYLSVFASAPRDRRSGAVARFDAGAARERQPLPEMRIAHLLSLCDDTGMLQHSVHSVADRSHGYCVDDNARALLLSCALHVPGEQALPEILTARLAAFMQHAWNPDTGRFRNFMSFDRRWLEDVGSEDSHGRSLWALGECARDGASLSRRKWAAVLFAKALPVAEGFRSPRAWAFTLLGLDAMCAGGSEVSPDLERLRDLLADRLVALLCAVETPDWVWFEDVLGYDNARLPQALIVTGIATGVRSRIDAGIRSMRWLLAVQTTAAGLFRPVGTESFGAERKMPERFDQQPLEAAASVAACLAALSVDGDGAWREGAARAFEWFRGRNDLSSALVDVETGSCRDGLHFDRPNENCGAESVLAYLLSLAQMRQQARTAMVDRRRAAPPHAVAVQAS
jgi:glycosyltransferase involved in cell wall biosynthesis